MQFTCMYPCIVVSIEPSLVLFLVPASWYTPEINSTSTGSIQYFFSHACNNSMLAVLHACCAYYSAESLVKGYYYDNMW